MKTIRLKDRQGALAAAPPSLDFRFGHRQGRRRPRRDRAGRIARGPVPGLGRVQPGVEDPRAGLELRRGPAHRRGVPGRRVPSGPCGRRSRFDIPSDGVRLVHGESDGLPGLIVDRYGDTLVAQFLSAGAERWKAVLADALLKETGLAAPVRALGHQRPLARRPAGGHRLAARRRADRADHCASTAGRSRWTSPPATRPASTSTSATAGASSRNGRGACDSSACSTATATRAASPWPRWPAARRT